MPRQITAFSNPLVKAGARASREEAPPRRGAVSRRGPPHPDRGARGGPLPETLFFSDASHPLVRQLIAETEAAGGEAIETSADILHKISGKDNPQTVLGVYPAFDVSLEAIDRSAAPLWIVAQALRDPGNLGTILRTGDAVGAGGLILIDDCADPFSVEAVRASMGALFTQKIAAARWEQFLLGCVQDLLS